MVFSDTSTKDGLIQACEFWTGKGDAGISGNASLLYIFTSRINRAFDRIMPLLLSYMGQIRWDDTNNTDQPFGTVDMVANQPDYTALLDADGASILDIAKLMIVNSNGSTIYTALQRMTVDDDLAPNAMSPNNPSDYGIPTSWLPRGNTFFLWPCPNFSATAGIKIFFERQQSYFVYNDTTKKPGIPLHFHELLALYASLDWLLTNKSKSTVLIGSVQAEIKRQRQDLTDIISKRNPTRGGFRTAAIRDR